jgi:hypothetical protein
MTQSQTLVADAVEASRTVDRFFINVTDGNLDVGGAFDESCLAVWRRAMEACAQDDAISLACFDEDDDSIALEQMAAGGILRFRIRLPHCGGAQHLLVGEQFRRLLNRPSDLGTVSLVRITKLQNPFETEAFAVVPWADAPQPAPLRSPRLDASPRRFVKCLAPQAMAPSEIEPWLEKPGEHGPSEFHDIWKEAASVALCRSLTNEIYMDGDLLQCVLASTPSRRLIYGDERTPTDEEFASLQSCARWVFKEGADIEVRHTLLTNELGREWRDDRSYLDGLWTRLRPSLDAAKLAYRAHLKSGSKETLKSLSDLRKTLGDEIQKLMQQTRDLSANVWRDIAVALGVTAIRFGLDPTKIEGARTGFAIIFALTAIYIWASYWITLRTNKEFLQVIDDTRSAWRDKLYGYLDDDDYTSLANAPIRSAISAYDCTKKRTTVAVAVIVVALLGLATWESGIVEHFPARNEKPASTQAGSVTAPQSAIEAEKAPLRQTPLGDEKRER